jgi:hypothetical protein
MYQKPMLRWLVLVVPALLVGCPPPAQYAVERPGLPCDHAARVARRTLVALGYTITGLVEPSVERAGAVTGTKTGPDGKTQTGRVVIRCSATGAVLQPVEEGLVPDSYEFSRAFGYSFKSLVQRPDDEAPWQHVGLQVLVQAIDPFEARLDLGAVATTGDAVPVRITVRNNTDRAVRLEAARLVLVDAQGASHDPLAGPALAAALASNAAGERIRAELFGREPIGARQTRIGFLVYPAGQYREARVSIEDVETEETEGFVAPVE